MKTFAVKGKHSAPVVRRTRSNVHIPLGIEQKAQQSEIHHILCSTGTQAKLTIGQPKDKYEQEADRVAERVMAMPDLKHQRQPKTDEEEEKSLQTKPISNKPTIISSKLQSRIQSLKGRGQPLSNTDRSFFEPRFGVDFRHVRIHNNPTANNVAQSINARAFTRGYDVVFGNDGYTTGTTAGRRLLAHELTHVVQQKISNSSINNTLQRKWKRMKGKTHVWFAGSNRDTYSSLLRSKYRQPKSFYQCLRPIKVKESGVFGTKVFKGDTFDASLLSKKNAVNLSLQGYFQRFLENEWLRQWYGSKQSTAADDDIRKPSKKGQAIKHLVFAGHGWGGNEVGTFKISSAKDPGGSYPNAKAGIFPNKCLFCRGARAWFVGCQTSTFASAFAKKYMRRGSSSMGTKTDIFVEPTIYPAAPASFAKYAFKVRFVRGYNPNTNKYKVSLSKPLKKGKFHKSGYWRRYWGKR